jgi:hypothetical protein
VTLIAMNKGIAGRQYFYNNLPDNNLPDIGYYSTMPAETEKAKKSPVITDET